MSTLPKITQLPGGRIVSCQSSWTSHLTRNSVNEDRNNLKQGHVLQWANNGCENALESRAGFKADKSRLTHNSHRAVLAANQPDHSLTSARPSHHASGPLEAEVRVPHFRVLLERTASLALSPEPQLTLQCALFLGKRKTHWKDTLKKSRLHTRQPALSCSPDDWNLNCNIFYLLFATTNWLKYWRWTFVGLVWGYFLPHPTPVTLW